MESVRTNYLLRLQAIVGEETVQYLVHCESVKCVHCAECIVYNICFILSYPPASKNYFHSSKTTF